MMLQAICIPSRRRSTMPEPQTPAQLDELSLSPAILQAIRESDGDTFGPEFALVAFLDDLAEFPRCTYCGIRIAPEAQRDCATCS